MQCLDQLLVRWFPDMSITDTVPELTEEPPEQDTPVEQQESPEMSPTSPEISGEVLHPDTIEVEPPILDALITAVETVGDSQDENTDEKEERQASQGMAFSPTSAEEPFADYSEPEREDDP